MTRVLIRPELLCAWKGSSLLVVNLRGECGPDQGLSGFYWREARFLRTLRVEIDGEPPWLCESSAAAPDVLQFTYTYPEVRSYGGGGTGQSGDEEAVNARGLPQRALALRLLHVIQPGRLDTVLSVTNSSRAAVAFELGWALSADFADIQEAHSDRPVQVARVRAARDGHRLRFEYEHDRLPYQAEVELPPDRDWQVVGGRAVTGVRLDPGQSAVVPLRVDALDGYGGVTDAERAEREAHLRCWHRRFADVLCPGNTVFEQVLSRNVEDVASFPLLDGAPDEWLAPQAGVPLYPAFFGRDAITAGWQTACLDCGEMLDAALTRLGRLQSARVNDWRDEEPGRIPYQVRSGPLALLEKNPYAAYYADYASPLMFVISLANLFAWSGDAACLRRHWDTAQRILDWARQRGDQDGDGYLEYRTRSTAGTKNQGWKDSGDAIVYDNGSPVPLPIATCELQGYWYAAQQLMGLLSWMRGARGDARAHLRSAAELKRRFNRDWWVEEEQFFALAMDPDKRPVRAPSSNVGHCLASGIIARNRLAAAVERMFAPDMFSGWGIRTLSSDHLAYDPLSYHRGTVWAVEQATIVFGLRRYGFDERALELARALVDLAQLYPGYRIPECVGGYPRTAQPSPGAYPQANTPQLWNASAFPLVVQSMLGLLPLAPYGLLIVHPALPPWLREVIVRNLRVGGATATLRFWRSADGRSHFDVLRKRGTLHVVRQPPPESLSAGLGDRFRALLETVVH